MMLDIYAKPIQVKTKHQIYIQIKHKTNFPDYQRFTINILNSNQIYKQFVCFKFGLLKQFVLNLCIVKHKKI